LADETATYCANCEIKTEEPVQQEEAPVVPEEEPITLEEVHDAPTEEPVQSEEAPAAPEEEPVAPEEAPAPQPAPVVVVPPAPVPLDITVKLRSFGGSPAFLIGMCLFTLGGIVNLILEMNFNSIASISLFGVTALLLLFTLLGFWLVFAGARRKTETGYPSRFIKAGLAFFKVVLAFGLTIWSLVATVIVAFGVVLIVAGYALTVFDLESILALIPLIDMESILVDLGFQMSVLNNYFGTAFGIGGVLVNNIGILIVVFALVIVLKLVLTYYKAIFRIIKDIKKNLINRRLLLIRRVNTFMIYTFIIVIPSIGLSGIMVLLRVAFTLDLTALISIACTIVMNIGIIICVIVLKCFSSSVNKQVKIEAKK